MTIWTLVKQGLKFYRRTHLGVLAGVAVGVAVLVGALAVGDSVRGSLREMASARLGQTRLAMIGGEGFFRSALGQELSAELSSSAAACIMLGGSASVEGGSRRANDVQVLGVDERFWSLGGVEGWAGQKEMQGADSSGRAGGVAINDQLAARLGVRAGDTVILRFEKPGTLAREAPMSSLADPTESMSLRVEAVLDSSHFGWFALRAEPVVSPRAFVRLETLQERLDLRGKANLLLVGPDSAGGPTKEQANQALRKIWRLADAGLEVRLLGGRNLAELTSENIFLADPATEAAGEAVSGAVGILTYFVNEIRVGERTMPYSTVCAMDFIRRGEARPGEIRPDPIPSDLRDNEIAFSPWLAERLKPRLGDRVEIKYFMVAPGRRLAEKKAEFRYLREVSSADWADPTLMPDFPGLTGAESCSQWKPGVPIDLDLVNRRPEIEEYWKQYRGSPKAFLSLAGGQKIWVSWFDPMGAADGQEKPRSRFGSMTAVRFPLSAGGIGEINEAIRNRLDPGRMGLFFTDVRSQAIAGGNQSMDFGTLFLSLSVFLIAAAMLLMAMLFVFGLEQRTAEAGVLLATGFAPWRIRTVLLGEAAVLGLLGGIAGACLGLLYTAGVIGALGSLTQKVSGHDLAGPVLRLHIRAATLLIGFAGGVAAMFLAMCVVVLRQARMPARQLLSEGAEAEAVRLPKRGCSWRWRGMALGFLVCVAAGVVFSLPVVRKQLSPPAAFMIVGSLVLIVLLAICHTLLRLAETAGSRRSLSIAKLGLRNCSRRIGRSMAVAILLALGCFAVIAVGANRKDVLQDAGKRSSGTGGFALFASSAVPLYVDPDSPEGRQEYGLDGAEMNDVRIVSLRVRDGDDASCLNMERPQSPRVLGVRAEELQGRGAFRFIRMADAGETGNAWLELNRRDRRDSTQAVADQATIVWALGETVGRDLKFPDDQGRPFKIRMVGMIDDSILQGSLVISEREFLERFPSRGGYRMFLIDCPADRARAVSDYLSRAMQAYGLDVAPAGVRLLRFHSVEDMYLTIFQALGGLGLLLGSIGMGVVVLRNVMQRRGELALLAAVGYTAGQIRRMILSEHLPLLAAGLVCGTVAGIVSVLPALLTPGAHVPYASLGLTVLAVAASGTVWTWLAAAWAGRGPLLSALRNE